MHFPKTGKMPSLATENTVSEALAASHPTVQLFTVDTMSAYSSSASDMQMVERRNMIKVVDQIDPHHD